MSESTNPSTTVETPAGKSVAKATSGKAKAAPKKVERTDLQCRRVELVKTLRKSGATSATAAKDLATLAERLKVERLDVYHLVNGASGKAGSSPTCLIATGHVKITAHENLGLCVYLTKEGSSTDFSESPFSR